MENERKKRMVISHCTICDKEIEMDLDAAFECLNERLAQGIFVGAIFCRECDIAGGTEYGGLKDGIIQEHTR